MAGGIIIWRYDMSTARLCSPFCFKHVHDPSDVFQGYGRAPLWAEPVKITARVLSTVTSFPEKSTSNRKAKVHTKSLDEEGKDRCLGYFQISQARKRRDFRYLNTWRLKSHQPAPASKSSLRAELLEALHTPPSLRTP